MQRKRMEKRLSQQIQDVIDQLEQAAEQTDHVQQTLRAELEERGLSFDAFDEDIERVLQDLRKLKALVKRYDEDEGDAHGGNGSPLA
jgi:DNA repair ATPase RecN